MSEHEHFTSVDATKRFFTFDAGATYTIVAHGPSHAWRIFGEHIETCDVGEDMLDDSVHFEEMEPERVATVRVFDEGPGVALDADGKRPLSTAEVGAVYCSEF